MKLLIGFDLDGVILDSDHLTEVSWLTEAFMETLREFGIPETEENVQALHIVNLRKNIQVFCQRFGVSDPDRLLARREENYVNNKLAALEEGEITLFPDVAALEELAEDYPLGIASNSPQVVVDRVVDSFSLGRLFRVCIGRGSSLKEIRNAKPSPHLLERLKAALGATRGCYVGDQPEDLQAACAASLFPIRINRDGGGGDIATLYELKRFLVERKLAIE